MNGCQPDKHGYELDYSDERVDVNVHGGLSYADRCAGHICHVPQPGESDAVWWLDFDCGHCNDYTPSHGRYRGTTREVLFSQKEYETYRDVEYVKREVESLAAQIKAVV